MKNLIASCLLLFSFIVYSQPNLSPPDNLEILEYPFDGFSSFDLTLNENQLLNGIDPTTVSITYHVSIMDADLEVNPIANPTSYTNLSNPQTIYVRVEEIISSLYTTISFDIEVIEDIVFIPDPNFLSAIIADGVDTNNSGNIQHFEAENVTVLTTVYNPTTDITGIEAFVNLIEFNCFNTGITTIDLSSNPLLERLHCGYGPVQNINVSNCPNLIYIQSQESFLTEIDLSNNPMLQTLYIQQNDLTSLDLSHNPNLNSISISSNPLQFLNIKNGADDTQISWFANTFNPNNFPTLEFVCADDTEVLAIQQIAGTSYVVSSFCNFQPGGDINTISGTIHLDTTNNGCDSTDPVVPYLTLNTGLDPQQLNTSISTDSSGSYNFYISQPGNYSIQPNLENPSYFIITPNNVSINVSAIDSTITVQDFCISPNGSVADAEVVITPLIGSNPGFDAVYNLIYKNKGNEVLSGNVTFAYDDSVLDLESSSTIPDAQTTGLLTFNFSNLNPFESESIEITLNVNSPMETPPVNIDDSLDFTATINIDQAEETPNDNTFDYTEVVVGSFDPNDITCLQGEVVPDSDIGEFLHYLIRFENTGTAPAQNVVVTMNVNSSDYDINTLQIINTSHDMSLRNNNGTLEFVFEGIGLPANGGQGYILLKMKTLSTLTLTDEVQAQANIYFDFNFPIITNVANTSFQTLSKNQFVSDPGISVFPNPAVDNVNVKTKSILKGITLYDLQGRIISSYSNFENAFNQTLDVSGLSRGVYFIKINTTQGEVTKKLIKK